MNDIDFYGHIEEDEEQKMQVDKVEEEMEVQQIQEKVQQEQTEIQNYNRFKEIQIDYAKEFFYSETPMLLKYECSVSFIPFEARMDKTSYELILDHVKPKNLICINLPIEEVAVIAQCLPKITKLYDAC